MSSFAAIDWSEVVVTSKYILSNGGQFRKGTLTVRLLEPELSDRRHSCRPLADGSGVGAESTIDRGHAAHVAEGIKRAKYADHSPDFDTLIGPSSQLSAVETFRSVSRSPWARIFFGCVLAVPPTTSRVRLARREFNLAAAQRSLDYYVIL
jgi:hypothetical protein